MRDAEQVGRLRDAALRANEGFFDEVVFISPNFIAKGIRSDTGRCIGGDKLVA